MSGFFLSVVNMSISASWIVLAVLVLRWLLKKAPKWIMVLLWGIVAVRLVCPFSIESVMSVIPSAQTISKAPDAPRPHFESGVTIVDNQVNEYLQGHYFEGVTRPAGHFADITTIFAIVWVVGIVALLVYTVISYLRVKNKVRTAVLLRENIFQSENVVSPFVLGIIKPKIYLPFSMSEQDMAYVIAHENAHIRRKDHWWKPLGFLVLTLHWFNPLMWLGYVLLCRDIEIACDEKVVKELDVEQKADYSEALLACSVNRRMIAACPLAFGEVSVKNRVKSVLNYKKPAFWIVLTAVIASVAVAVCFLTNPKKNLNDEISSQQSGSDLSGISLQVVDVDLAAPDPFLDIKWENNTKNEVDFGDPFIILYNQDGTWENCSIEEYPIWNAPAYLVKAKSAVTHTYKLNGQIMTRPGKYRFEASFTMEGSGETHKAWVEFELKEGVEGVTVHTFRPAEIVYDDGMYSYVQTVDAAPTYMLVNGMQLLEKTDGNVSEPLGVFEEITLSENNFGSRFRSSSGYSWLSDDTLRSLKRNNKRIWQLYGDSKAETPRLYILLEQKDGTFYLGYGYYNCGSNNSKNSDDSHIRWLYKLSESADDKVVKDPHAPIVESNEQNDETIKFQIVDEEYLGDHPISLQYYDAKVSSQSWKIVVETTKDVTNFRFIELDESEKLKIGDTLFELETLKANSPLLLHTYINDAALNRGISYQEDNGAVRYFGFNYHLNDGTISLFEIDAEEFYNNPDVNGEGNNAKPPSGIADGTPSTTTPLSESPTDHVALRELDYWSGVDAIEVWHTQNPPRMKTTLKKGTPKYNELMAILSKVQGDSLGSSHYGLYGGFETIYLYKGGKKADRIQVDVAGNSRFSTDTRQEVAQNGNSYALLYAMPETVSKQLKAFLDTLQYTEVINLVTAPTTANQ